TKVYQRQIVIWLGPSPRNNRVGRILIHLLGSGFIFCSICVSRSRASLAQISSITIVQIAWTVMTLVDFSHALMPVMQGFAGIYATLVILMVAVQEHLTSDPALASQSSFLASIRFLSPDEEPDSAD
ncbi:hypothetical protein K525DRAFT_206359, partial [Schizophyllum commune Loenen D]